MLNRVDIELPDLLGIMDVIETGFDTSRVEGLEHFLDVVLCNKVYSAVMKDVRVVDVKEMMRQQLESKKKDLLEDKERYEEMVIKKYQDKNITFMQEEAGPSIETVESIYDILKRDEEFKKLYGEITIGELGQYDVSAKANPRMYKTREEQKGSFLPIIDNGRIKRENRYIGGPNVDEMIAVELIFGMIAHGIMKSLLLFR